MNLVDRRKGGFFSVCGERESVCVGGAKESMRLGIMTLH